MRLFRPTQSTLTIATAGTQTPPAWGTTMTCRATMAK